MILAILLLFSGLAISAVAIYYSVVGLTAIFAAAAIPIMIMGVSLEVGKLVIASWVKAYWERIPFLMRAYAVIGVTILMVITSLGIFGFLSKAHSDQTLVSGDVQSKIAIYDEKIKTAKDNIDANRKALKQMDDAVDQVMGRSADEKGAEKAVAIRRGQTKERTRLLSEITAEQKTIAQLSEERAPIAAEVRKVEAEVGPIKYIAAFVYGDNPDASILERAVTWVIILIVIVFDPLAVVMLLAAQMTFHWYKRDQNPVEEPALVEDASGRTESTIDSQIDEIEALGDCYKCGTPLINAPGIGPFCPNKSCDVVDATNPDAEPIELAVVKPNAVELAKFDLVDTAPLATAVDVVHETEPDPLLQELATELETAIRDRDELAEFIRQTQSDLDVTVQAKTELEGKLFALERDVQSLLARIAELEHKPDPGFVYQPEAPKPITDFPELQAIIKQGLEDGTIQIEGTDTPTEQDQEASVAEVAPDAQPEPEVNGVKAEIIPDVERPGDYITDPVANLFKRKPNAGFGAEFPDNPARGDMFLRTDFRPTRLFKWNNTKWIEVNKNATDAYSYNDAYIQFLAQKLMSGEYQFDDLTDTEQQQVQTILGGARG